ncbi:MAG: glycine zipper domain-containing protein [Ginsengibacter sp.]
MKKLFMCWAVISVFAACKSRNVDTTDVTGLDTTLLYKNNVYSDTASIQDRTVAPKPARSQTSAPVARPSTNTGTQSQTTQKKEGWSNSTKGAVIGGVGGAVVGAVVSKKKVQGAVIGGAVGATGGYIIGRAKDKKEDRIQ